ncbi:MAG: CDC27 family protein [Candidatus Gastranaerophilales bacterium]|nr:CDC27 family protein [Candidatus Gastranaerophilales bacterium]
MFKQFFTNREIKLAQKAVANQPENILKLDILGNLYLQNKQYKNAAEIFQNIIELDKTYLPAYLKLAQSLKGSFRYLYAFDTLLSLKELMPLDKQATELLFSLRDADTDLESKVTILEGLLKIEPGNQPLMEQLADTLLKNGEFTKSASMYEKLLAMEEKSQYAQQLALISEKQNNIPKAVELLEKLLLLGTIEKEFIKKLAHFYAVTERFEEAKSILGLLIESNPEEKQELLTKTAEIFILEKKYDEALEKCNEVIKENTFHSPAKFLMVKCYLEQKKYLESIDFLREFYYDPIDEKTEQTIVTMIIDACIAYCEELSLERKFDKAFDSLFEALKYNQSEPKIYMALAKLSDDIKDFDGAKEYRKIAEELLN